METTSDRFDEPAFYLADPHATYRRLRDEDPVHWYEEGQFWVLTKYEDIKYVSTHPLQFSSSRIAILSGLVQKRNGKEPGIEQGGAVMFMDPPEHGPYRKIVSDHFRPREVAGLEDHVRAVISDIVDELPEGEFDLIERLAEPVPVFVFSRLLGVPAEDWHRIVHWATVITNLGTGQGTEEDSNIVTDEVGPYLWALLNERRTKPENDLLTMLTRAKFNGRLLNEVEIIGWATTLLAAGSETTQSLIAGIGDVLDRFPDQTDQFYADTALAAGLVEETMRWWTPVMSMARQAVVDVTLRDKVIRAGDGVLLLYSSANRDEERWGADADEFRIRRPDAAGNLGFGIGEHFCVGVHLARREARVLLEELAARGRRLQVVGDPVPRQSALMHTYDHLPVHLI